MATEWKQLAERMGVGRSAHTAAVHGGVICAVGGEEEVGDDNPADTVMVYDTTTKVWSELVGGGMSIARMGCASAVYKGKLYVVGGQDDVHHHQLFRSVEVYDFATQQWSLLPTEMATARTEHGCVVCEDKLYVVGGYDTEGADLASVEVYDFATEAWSTLPAPMPQGRTAINNAIVQHKGKLYVVGGYTWVHGYLQSVAVYDVAAEAWSVLPAEMMVHCQAHAAAVHCNKIYVLGGWDEGYTALRSVEVYDIAAGEWSMMAAEMNEPRQQLAAAVHGGNLYAIGGGPNDDAAFTMEVLTLPGPPSWTPSRHSTVPRSLKRIVYTLMHCFARTNALPDDMLFKIIWFFYV